MKNLIIIPTYNEIENIELLIDEIFKVVPDISVLVVDDNSPDDTYGLVRKISNERPNVFAIKREGKLGLASAYIDGFKWGIEKGFDAFLEMDADFSHNPKYLKNMVENIQNYEVVIGSRNIKGGGVSGWSLLRFITSKGGSLYSRFVLGFPPVYDLTGGFNMWRKTALDKINLDSVKAKGYLFQIEMKYKAWKADCSIKEFPIHFENRRKGKSKMSAKIFLEAFINVWSIRFVRNTKKENK